MRWPQILADDDEGLTRNAILNRVICALESTAGPSDYQKRDRSSMSLKDHDGCSVVLGIGDLIPPAATGTWTLQKPCSMAGIASNRRPTGPSAPAMCIQYIYI